MCVLYFAGFILCARRWPGPLQSLRHVRLQWLKCRQLSKLVERRKDCQDDKMFLLKKIAKWLWPRQKKTCSFFLRNIGMSPSQLNFLLRMAAKKTLQNQQALSVRLKMWRQQASLRKRTRRIYLQSLKRGDSPGRGVGRHLLLFIQNSPAALPKSDGPRHIASVGSRYCCWGGSRAVWVGRGSAGLFCSCGWSFSLPPLNCPFNF